MNWIAIGLFVATLAYLLFRFTRFYRLAMDTEVPRDEDFRRTQRRMYAAIGLWEISVGLVLLAGPGPAPGSFSSSIGVIMVGFFFLGWSWLAGKFDSVLQ